MKRKIMIMLGVLVFVMQGIVCLAEEKEIADKGTAVDSEIVLTIPIGSGVGEINYSDTMYGGGEGPEAFTVTTDGKIYIVDNVNKKIIVYKNGEFLKEIQTEYITYVRSIVVAQEKVYLMDYDTGEIYVIYDDGNLYETISLPNNMESYLMQKLYVQDDGKVWLFYENDGDAYTRGENVSYLVEDLEQGKSVPIEGFTRNGTDTYNIVNCGVTVEINQNCENGITRKKLSQEIETYADSGLIDAQILMVDINDNVYVDAFEIIDASIVAGEYTIRKYSNENKQYISEIDLDDYYFMPNKVIEVSETGEVYQLKCYKDKVQILKKEFIDSEDFVSNIENIERKTMQQEEDVKKQNLSTRAVDAPNTWYTTMWNATDCCDLEWTYNDSNASNPNMSKVTTPDYLKSASTPSAQTGIPYCWGGFDSLMTSSSSTWSNFSDAMNNGKFAGNVNTATSGYQTGTAGLDCSGFVSSTAGFLSKLSTTSLASSQYTKAIEETDRTLYDIYVKSGSHVLYYVGTSSGGIKTREATTTGDDKTKAYTRSMTSLSGYELRRFNGW